MASKQTPETPGMASLRATEIGKIAQDEWYKTLELRKDMNVTSDEFVVMPNHVHGIIMIGQNQYNSIGDAGGGRDAMHGVSGEDAMRGVSTNSFGPQSKNLSSILRGYKSVVTTYAIKNNISFNWQPRFHDHIIRSWEEYQRIAHYVINNPTQWLNDKFYPGGWL